MSKDTSTYLCSSCEATAGDAEIPRPVPCETSGSSLPRGSIPSGRNHGEAWKGSDGRVSDDMLDRTFSKLDKPKPLNALLPLHRQSVSGNTRCFKNKFPLGSIFFPKAQPAQQCRLN